MWNLFDSSFVVVFLVYLGLRLKGLIYNDGTFLPWLFNSFILNIFTSQLLPPTWRSMCSHVVHASYFHGRSMSDLLPSSPLKLFLIVSLSLQSRIPLLSCIFCPFISNHVAADGDCRSLRAMISDFMFFISVACICFSGLLFTLRILGKRIV